MTLTNQIMAENLPDQVLENYLTIARELLNQIPFRNNKQHLSQLKVGCEYHIAEKKTLVRLSL